MLLGHAVLVTSAAAMLVILLRKTYRRIAGARVAYWIWLLVPAAALAVLLPQTAQPIRLMAGPASRPLHAVLAGALSTIDRVATPDYATVLLAVWGIGAVLSLAVIMGCHLRFVGSLGKMSVQPDGTLRAPGCREPILIGIVRPRIILPPHFDTAYGANERAMVLAHERAHLRRCDPQLNAAAAIWLCLSWFNPLMYWALRLFRVDQELACDATVLAAPGTTRRGYADALLKTQLAGSPTTGRTMIGCHWHSIHPLSERIRMLKHPLPGALRRRAGLALTIAFVIGATFAVRAVQAPDARSGVVGPLIAINVKAFINGAQVLVPTQSDAGWDILVRDGGRFVIGNRGQLLDCTARMPTASDTTSDTRNGAVFVINCSLSHDKTVFATPLLLAREDETASVEVTDKEGVRYRLAFNVSVSPARVALLSAAQMNPQPDGVRSFKLTPVAAPSDATVEVFSSAPDGSKGGVVPWQLERKDN